ncbi:unnamed protein product [Phyllotreta striolata]|uniref:Gustatory receptor n=1 Tax=Phyllotreta striolata TaxID=444603 RepID=A0A9N9TMF0_PHYSR|nr:unnamed protein product [Phyllotreta striolata]
MFTVQFSSILSTMDFHHRRIKDTYFVDFWYKAGIALGLFPWTLQKGFMKHQIIALAFSFLAFSILSVYIIIDKENCGYGMGLLIFTSLDNAAHGLFNLIILYDLVMERKRWRTLKELFHYLDKNLNYTNYVSDTYITFYIIGSILHLLLNIYANWHFFFKNSSSVGIVSGIIWNLYQMQKFITIGYLINVSLLLKRRIEKCCRILENLVKNPYQQKTEVAYKLMSLKNYKYYVLIVWNLNSLFGRKLLLFLVMAFITILDEVQFILDIDMSDIKIAIVLENLTELILIMVLTIIIAIAGDIIEKSGDKMIKLLNILQLSIEDDFLKQELSKFAALVTELRPSLSVAGFFDVNRKLLPMLLSSFTAYIIILIQLK